MVHVLIVDDNKVMRKQVRQVVSRCLRSVGLGETEFSEASNGKEAFDFFQKSRHDLILSDWNMPELDGMGLLQAVRNLDPDVPFGLITAQVTPALKESARYYGAQFLIAKPFTPESLSEAVENLF